MPKNIKSRKVVPIEFEYDYTYKYRDVHEGEFFEELLGTNIEVQDIIDKNDEEGVFYESEFSSLKDLDWILDKIKSSSVIDKILMSYGTLNYADKYDGVVFRYHEPTTKQCHYCNDLYPATIPPGEIFLCCKECLCACSEISHKGNDAPLSKMCVINSGGIFFRVCIDCIPQFNKLED